jgi:hypothetical protein
MEWFCVVLAFDIAVAGATTDDRSISLILVRATDAAAAREEARRLAADHEVSYPNADGETVSWRMSDVLNVSTIADDALREGTDVYSFMVSAELLEDIKTQLR